MIFVTVGTQKFGMNRLLQMVDHLIESGEIKEPVFMQTGYSTYHPKNCEYVSFLDKTEMSGKISACSVLISHAGVGSLLEGLNNKKKVIAVPRKKQFHEHVDDHQEEIAAAFSEKGYILRAANEQEIVSALRAAETWTPTEYISTHASFLQNFRDILEPKPGILFYSSLGSDMLAHTVGGAETGSKRTLEILEKFGCKVFKVAKPTLAYGGCSYIKQAISAYRQVKRILSSENISLLYVVGYYERNIYLEWLIIRCAKKNKIKIVYEPKNGIFASFYQKSGLIYRNFVKKVVLTSDVLFCQGKPYVTFLKEQFARDGIYLPNYVMQRYLQEKAPQHDAGETVKLIFFGRLTESKNISFMLEICKQLFDRNIGNDLTLVGSCDEKYRSVLEKKMENLGLTKNQVHFYGHMDFDELSKELVQSDFFLFPSTNYKEGHSNALTEAMAFGVIPIASDIGFNRDVIGNDYLIVPEMKAESYARKIAEIAANADEMQGIRQELVNRVNENFTESIITKRMKDALLLDY